MAEHVARKRFGQNFLHDTQVIDNIVAAIHPRDDELLVEIGPGQGALTAPLLAKAGQLCVVELDRDLIPLLEAQFGSQSHFELIAGDALRTDFTAIAKRYGKSLRIVGNLPYNISTPLIFKLLESDAPIIDMHFMLQKEVVDRLTATPGTPHWGKLGIMAQYHCTIERLLIVEPGAFRPAPKVRSAVARLTPHRALPIATQDLALLRNVVTTAFNQRRKTLRNALQTLGGEALLVAANVDPGQRPDVTTLEEFVRIADILHQRGIESE